MATVRCLSLVTIFLAVLMLAVDGTLTNTELSASCGQHSFYHPLRGVINCSRVCPPVVSTDINVRFCSLNCVAYYRCLRGVFAVVESATTSNNSSCPTSWFYHPHHGFVECGRVCSTPDVTRYCQNNCPLYYRCLTQS